MKIYLQNGLSALLLICCVLASTTGSVGGGQTARIAIVPFKINADRDLSFLRDGIVDMLESRLSWKDAVAVIDRAETEKALKGISGHVTEQAARDLGVRLEADYVLFGSLTVLGSSASLDARLVGVRGRQAPVTYFNQSAAIDDIIPEVNDFAARINEQVFGRAPVARKAPAPPAPAPRQPSTTFAHPERLLTPGVGWTAQGQQESQYPGFERVRPATPQMGESGFWRSRSFKFKINSLAVADLDGDKHADVVFVTDDSLQAYRVENRRLIQMGKIQATRYQRFIGVDAADINDNGRAEAFVTALSGSGRKLDSFVVEWEGSGFSTVAKQQPWYYRVITEPDVGKVLLGQRRTMDDLFLPSAKRLTWQGGRYEPEGPVTLPKGTTILGYAVGRLTPKGQEMIVAFDDSDHLRLFSASGAERWTSDDVYGGNVNFLERNTQTGRGDSPDRLYLPQRIGVFDVDGDGADEVIVPNNQGKGARFLANYRKFTNGRVVILGARGPGLTKTLRSSKVAGYVADFAVGDLDADGSPEVVVAAVRSKGSLITSGKSTIMAFPLVVPQEGGS